MGQASGERDIGSGGVPEGSATRADGDPAGVAPVRPATTPPPPLVAWEPPPAAPARAGAPLWGPSVDPRTAAPPGAPPAWGAAWVAAPRARSFALPSTRRVTLVGAATALFSFAVIVTLATRAAVAFGLPDGMAGTPETARSLPLDLALMAVLLADAVALRRVLAGWLGRASDAAGRDLLADRPEDPERGLPPIAGAGRRTRAVRDLTAAGLALLVAGAAAWMVPVALVARAGLVVAGLGAAALLAATVLVAGVLRAAERVADVAEAPAGGPPAALTPDITPRLGAVAAVIAAAAAMSIGVASGVEAAGPCSAPSTWTCATMIVRADHGGTATVAPVMRVTYAVLPARQPVDGTREVLVYATGGPGSSGLAEAGWLESELPEAVRNRFDIVVFDPRGTGASGGVECPRALRAYLGESTTPALAQTFARDCPAEAGVTGTSLRAYATAQVVGDLEALRRELGVDRVTLVGSSYGTRVAQDYAVAHPDRVRAILLDAPVDRSLTPAQLWGHAARRFEDVIGDVFEACTLDSWCSADLPDPAASLHRVRLRLQDGQVIAADVPLASGRTARLSFGHAQFEAALADAMYDPATRMLFLRSLAAVDAGDDRPLAAFVGLDPGGGDRRSTTYETSEFAYYATWCSDARVSPTHRDDDVDGFIEAARRAAGGDAMPVNEVALTLLPCLWWGVQPPPGPAPSDVAGVPTLILTASADPITRVEEARALHDRIDGSVLIETTGGAHGTFLAPDACSADHVERFLVEVRLPDQAAVVCDGDLTWGYVPLAGADTSDALTAIEPLESEIYGSAEYLWWDGSGDLTLACLHGGAMTLRAGNETDLFEIEYDRCRWVDGGPEFIGTGQLDWTTGEMEVMVRGEGEDRGALTYQREADGGRRVTGSWNGDRVDVAD